MQFKSIALKPLNIDHTSPSLIKNRPYMFKATLYDADPAHKPIILGSHKEDQDKIYCFVYKGI